jgi:nanoRNase/pAp phosphatase (c-di-AMP/oligoRNAs hydrolase)
MAFLMSDSESGRVNTGKLMPLRRPHALYETIGDAKRYLILTHNDPDPDAIASAAALQWLLEEKIGAEGHVVYKGIVGRAENKALVRYLGYPLRLLTEAEVSKSLPVALVDTQPGAGNNALPPSSNVAIVFDHHPLREETSTAGFFDVRPDVGATSTILTEYCQAVGGELPPAIATALFYGIKTDTMGLGRGASQADVAAYFYLQSRVDVQALVNIERAQVPPEYFQGLVAALESAYVYDDVLIAYIGEMQRPDLTAEMADLFLRLRGVDWVICMGVYENEMTLSVRTNSQRGAGQLIQSIVGDLGSAGGHGSMSAGQIPLEGQNPDILSHRLKERVLKYLEIDSDVVGEKLT